MRPLLLGTLSVGLSLLVACSRPATPSPSTNSTPTNSNSSDRLSPEIVAQLAALEAQERLLNESVWAPDILAQHHARIFERLWDSANAASNKLALFADFPFHSIRIGKWSLARNLPHDIAFYRAHAPGPLLSPAEWRLWIQQVDQEGWLLAELEFRHVRFVLEPQGHPGESTFYFAAQLLNPTQNRRAILEGDLIVHWSPPEPDAELSGIHLLDATRLTFKCRSGKPPFEARIIDRLSPPRNTQSIDPIILYDLDRDGLSEIITVARNLVYRRQPDSNAYLPETLCRFPPSAVYTAIVADFNRDGPPDLLAATLAGLELFPGSGQISFDLPSSLAFAAPDDWRYPMVLTAGDIDHDGDLDLFLGQYRVPYENGSLPTPYYNANDGNPAFLLLNDGHARFTDATHSANLTAKRWRRTYGASLADLNDDQYLDLVVVSDFAGLDLYLNNGQGRFTDVTHTSIPDPRAFGMSHTLADFNSDGLLDLLMIGMTSPTVDRLQQLNLWRPDIIEDRTMPGRMMYGNRLYLAHPDRTFAQSALSDDIARSGWSWGCAAFDFDNDSFVDLFIANGLESRSSVRDYESEYWLHDRFIANSTPRSDAYLYFQSKFSRTRGRGHSYGGYERNRFYLNHAATHFLDVGHLLNLSLQEDSRHAVADDLDADGRMDLVVTGFEPWPASRQILRIYQNTLQPSGHWIGFKFHNEPQTPSPIGASVSIHYPGGGATRQIVTGDSHRSQQPNTIHFGLGQHDALDRVRIAWPGGTSLTITNAAVNQYHQIRVPRSR